MEIVKNDEKRNGGIRGKNKDAWQRNAHDNVFKMYAIQYGILFSEASLAASFIL